MENNTTKTVKVSDEVHTMLQIISNGRTMNEVIQDLLNTVKTNETLKARLVQKTNEIIAILNEAGLSSELLVALVKLYAQALANPEKRAVVDTVSDNLAKVLRLL